ncbi:hypothetical protein JRQ81_014432 [Phrynocephalus forsythii]|uniref:Uncharacterized protein n=1 Tax=Phrynocephalus forsythii TaxID=171643 RepID=A0A9Q1B2U4_9SAUR|nr:hypothetical protein JRQ81_014432 [Phrynocephalus forsythii]
MLRLRQMPTDQTADPCHSLCCDPFQILCDWDPMSTMDEPSCGCHRGPHVEHGKWYGVRSYLHLFYEDCTGASLDDDLKEPSAGPVSPGWISVVWKSQ